MPKGGKLASASSEARLHPSGRHFPIDYDGGFSSAAELRTRRSGSNKQRIVIPRLTRRKRRYLRKRKTKKRWQKWNERSASIPKFWHRCHLRKRLKFGLSLF